MQCNTWAYLAVYDGLGFIFLDSMGFFCVFFPLDPVAAAEGCASSMLISFVRGGSRVEALRQHAEICLVALYIGLNIVSAVGLVCISLYNVITCLCRSCSPTYQQPPGRPLSLLLSPL